MLYHICSLLSGVRVEEVPKTNWVIVELDEDHKVKLDQFGNPIFAYGLHEYSLEFDPDGKEFRPKLHD